MEFDKRADDNPGHVTYSDPDTSSPTADTVTMAEHPTNYMILSLAITAAVAGAVFILLFVLFIIRKCSPKRKNSMADFELDNCNNLTTKSEPSTRSSSPKLGKKTALANQGGGVSSKKAAMLMRSLTVDMIPDFQLPPERVQPPSDTDKARHTRQTSLQFQHSLLSSLSLDIPGGPTDPDDPEQLPSSCGRLWFSLVYDAAVEELAVNLVKAKYLKPRDKAKTPRDPFVKIYLLPDEKSCRESRVRKKTLSPKFNETFTFKVPCEEIMSRTIRMSIYDVDKRRVRHCLGHVIIPLVDIDLTHGDSMWKDLELSQNTGCLGDLNMSLNYSPATEKLKVVMLRAKSLRKLEFDNDNGIHIKVQLLHGQKVHKTRRTHPIKGTCEPVFNESFVFTVPSRQIDTCSVIVTVIAVVSGRIGTHEEEYGKVTVGPFMYARGEELMHWQDMMAQPRTTVSLWHQLSVCHKNNHD